MLCGEAISAFSFETAATGDIVTAAAQGPFDVAGFRQLIDAAGQDCAAGGFSRLLLDITGVAPPKSEIDRYTVGAYAAERLGHRVRVAVLWQDEHINRFGENTAVNRGAVHRVFSDRAEALAWLRDD